MVGKDILRFHAIYWPAFLMAAGVAPQKRVFAHGWWTAEGQKMSKSLGNVLDPHELIAKYGLDPLRYFVLRELPFGQDGDFSHRQMVNRVNSDLANDLGNLAQRVLSFVAKNAGAKVPTPGEFNDQDHWLTAGAVGLLKDVCKELSEQQFHKALEAIWHVVAEANRYVDEQAPWTLRKTDPARMETVLYTLAEVLRRLALLVHAFMPASMDRLLDQLAVPATERTFAAWDKALVPGTALPAPTGIFPRYVEEGAAAPAAGAKAKGGKGGKA
jgi:methionyl-tRNA synthetase